MLTIHIQESRRKELEVQIESLKQARDTVQSDYSSHMKLHAAMLRDHEAELKRLSDQKAAIHEQYSDAKNTVSELQAEVAKLKSRLEGSQKSEKTLEEKISSLQTELQKARDQAAKEKIQLMQEIEKGSSTSVQREGLILRLKDEIRRCTDSLYGFYY
jgi:chromosome segregation ATPase